MRFFNAVADFVALASVALIVGCSSAKPVSKPAAGIPTEARKVPAGHVTYLVGGDSRGDTGHVLPWAFDQARAVSAKGFIFLGDMEWSRKCDDHFAAEEINHLGSIPLYPTLGNHEVRWFGAKAYSPEKQARIEAEFQARFLKSNGVSLPVEISAAPRPRIFYSIDLDSGDAAATDGKKGLHFIALDNVSDGGFGRLQIDWLKKDLATAGKNARWVIVGMHKPFVGTCVGKHSMAEDAEVGTRDSQEVLRILAGENDAKRVVNAIFTSHAHYYAKFDHEIAGVKIPTYVTGGLGAHLKPCHCETCRSFHHVLQLDVSGEQFEVSVIRWRGTEAKTNPALDKEDVDEDESEASWNMKCTAAPGRSETLARTE
jgi:Calcineurin-like phosphoesterase